MTQGGNYSHNQSVMSNIPHCFSFSLPYSPAFCQTLVRNRRKLRLIGWYHFMGTKIKYKTSADNLWDISLLEPHI